MSHFALSILNKSKIAWDTIKSRPELVQSKNRSMNISCRTGQRPANSDSHESFEVLQSSITKHHQRLKAVMEIWIHILTDLPALTLHGGRRRACNIHRACTKQHTLLLIKDPMKFMANPEKLWSHVLKRPRVINHLCHPCHMLIHFVTISTLNTQK